MMLMCPRKVAHQSGVYSESVGSFTLTLESLRRTRTQEILPLHTEREREGSPSGPHLHIDVNAGKGQEKDDNGVMASKTGQVQRIPPSLLHYHAPFDWVIAPDDVIHL